MLILSCLDGETNFHNEIFRSIMFKEDVKSLLTNYFIKKSSIGKHDRWFNPLSICKSFSPWPTTLGSSWTSKWWKKILDQRLDPPKTSNITIHSNYSNSHDNTSCYYVTTWLARSWKTKKNSNQILDCFLDGMVT